MIVRFAMRSSNIAPRTCFFPKAEPREKISVLGAISTYPSKGKIEGRMGRMRIKLDSARDFFRRADKEICSFKPRHLVNIYTIYSVQSCKTSSNSLGKKTVSSVFAPWLAPAGYFICLVYFYYTIQ